MAISCTPFFKFKLCDSVSKRAVLAKNAFKKDWKANKFDHLQFSTRGDRNLIFDHNEYLHVSGNLTTIENKAIAELHNGLFGINASIPTSPQTEFNSFC